MALAEPGLQPRPPSQTVSRWASRGPGMPGGGVGAAGQEPRPASERWRPLWRLLRRKKTTDYRNMAAAAPAAAAVHAGMMAAGRRRRPHAQSAAAPSRPDTQDGHGRPPRSRRPRWAPKTRTSGETAAAVVGRSAAPGPACRKRFAAGGAELCGRSGRRRWGKSRPAPGRESTGTGGAGTRSGGAAAGAARRRRKRAGPRRSRPKERAPGAEAGLPRARAAGTGAPWRRGRRCMQGRR